MKLRVPDLPEEEFELNVTADKEPWVRTLAENVFQEDFPKDSPARLDLHLLRTCQNVALTGFADVDIAPACDRCLQSFKMHFHLPLLINMAPAQEKEDEEDANFSFYKGAEIDLGEILREHLALEIPIRYLCSESCKGLCPQCGQNLNSAACSCVPIKGDPRLAVLKEFLKKSNG